MILTSFKQLKLLTIYINNIIPTIDLLSHTTLFMMLCFCLNDMWNINLKWLWTNILARNYYRTTCHVFAEYMATLIKITTWLPSGIRYISIVNSYTLDNKSSASCNSLDRSLWVSSLLPIGIIKFIWQPISRQTIK